MYRCIYPWSSLAPVLNRIASKNVRLVTLSYKDTTATYLAKQWWPCSDGYYRKETWYTQTFLCQLLRGRIKIQLFHYFGLLHDLLHRQDLLIKWFERKLNFFSAFNENLKPHLLGTTSSTSHSRNLWKRFCRNFIGYIRKSFNLAVINRL